jgi:hypothetical protein
MLPDLRVGCAGWSILGSARLAFPSEGTLQRYASRFRAVEINSSFHRRHRGATYARWAASVPDDFRSSVKAPRTITHERRLRARGGPPRPVPDPDLRAGREARVSAGPASPEPRLRPHTAEGFLASVRDRHTGPIALEPRHPSWFTGECDALLDGHRVARVAADPARPPGNRGDGPGRSTSGCTELRASTTRPTTRNTSARCPFGSRAPLAQPTTSGASSTTPFWARRPVMRCGSSSSVGRAHPAHGDAGTRSVRRRFAFGGADEPIPDAR